MVQQEWPGCLPPTVAVEAAGGRGMDGCSLYFGEGKVKHARKGERSTVESRLVGRSIIDMQDWAPCPSIPPLLALPFRVMR